MYGLSKSSHVRSKRHVAAGQCQNGVPLGTYIVQFHSMVSHNLTRRFPWGIQRLVSTYSNCNPILGSQNWKCQDLPKFQFSRVFLDKSRTPLVQNSKCQDLANFSFPGGGWGYSWPGKNRVFLPKWAKICHASHILEGLASQTVSHILRMWRLIGGTEVGNIKG